MSSIPAPEPIFVDLREQILKLSADEAGLKPPEGSQIWGLMMEIGYPEAVATLVTLADGTTSLYLGNGGGIIGAGEHANVREATARFLATGDTLLELLANTDNYPLPTLGQVRFYALTTQGVLTALVDEEKLGDDEHALSPLFFAGHAVIGEMRQIET